MKYREFYRGVGVSSEAFFKTFSRKVLEAGVSEDPVKLLRMQIIFLIASVIFAVMLIFLGFYILLPLSAIVAITPLLYLEDKKTKRALSIERELPFFLAYASIIQKSGVNLYDALRRTGRYDVFKTMRDEGKLLSLSLGRSPPEILKDYADFNPNKDFKRVLESYLNILRSGGDTSTLLEDSLNVLLNRLRYKAERFVDIVGLLAEVLVAIFILLPLVLIIGAIAFAQYQTLVHVWFFILAIPLLAAVLYFVIDRVELKIPSEKLFDGRDILIISVGVLVSLILFPMLNTQFDFVTAMGIFLIAALSPPAILFNMKKRVINSQDASIPPFLRDLTERIRTGSDILKALDEISTFGSYDRNTRDVLSKIKKALSINTPMHLITSLPWIKSWLFKYTMFMISELTSLGALTVNPLSSLTRFIEDFSEIRSDLTRSLTPYVYLFILTPVLIAMPTTLMQAILIEQFEKALFPLPGLSPAAIRTVIYFMKIMIIVLSVSLGILASKILYGTYSNTTYACFSLAVALLTIALSERLIEIFV